LPSRANRRFLALLSALLLAFTAAIAGCGGGGGGNEQDARALVKKAFSQKIQSADVKLDLQAKIEGVTQLKGPIKLSMSGPFQSGAGKKIPSLDWKLSLGAQGQTFNAGLISTGDNAFVSFQGNNYEVGNSAVAQLNAQLQRTNAQNGSKSLSDFGVKADNWLNDAKEEGDEKIEGVETKHVSGSFDVGRFLDDLNQIISKAGSVGGRTPTQLTDQQKKQVEQFVKNPKFDVYVGKDDNKIRRLAAELNFDVPDKDRAQLGGASGGSLTFSVEFANVGQPQQISAPTNAKPISELASQLGGLGALGGLGGGAAGGGSSSVPGGAGAGSNKQKLEDCIKKLGGASDKDARAFCEGAYGK
jgi:hypothetical protein